ncbi:TetR/AcrR family transcriptional regulator [Vibrio maerlii]|uniref:TetR/AcrR family transcriptional regulator n=1 Tax=Vibrio maerlii TaxID=2231648 RepID=UPI000E3BBE15|nr:TetR/AcrR family transcriptional regulator [Vibrio maerlii]
MARITQEQRDKNKQVLDDLIWKIFTNEGWDAITYQRLADEFGSKKSTMQRYYPSQDDFLDGIRGRPMKLLAEQLDTSSPEALLESWFSAMEHPHLANVFSMALSTAVEQTGNQFAAHGTQNLRRFLNQHFAEATAEQLIYDMYGGLIVNTADAKVNEDMKEVSK